MLSSVRFLTGVDIMHKLNMNKKAKIKVGISD